MTTILQYGSLAVSGVDEGQGPPVVLLHSGGLSSRQWGRLTARLRGERRVVAPDLLGYGTTGGFDPAAPFAITEDEALVLALLDSLPAPVALVGHSYGGLLALMVARRRPGAVSALAVYEPVSFGVLHEPRDEPALSDLRRLDPDGTFLDDAAGGSETWLESFVDWWNGPGAWAAMAPASRQGFLTAGRKLYAEVNSLTRDRTTAAGWSVITAPTLLLVGQHSPLAEQHVIERLARGLPRATVRRVDAGHMGPISHARDVNEAIAAHLASSLAR